MSALQRSVLPDDNYYLGTRGLTSYFRKALDEVFKVAPPDFDLQPLGKFNSFPYTTDDQVDLSFRQQDEIIEMYRLDGGGDDPLQVLFARFDLRAGQMIDTHHVYLPGKYLHGYKWQLTDVWTGADGQPYLVAYKSKQAIVLQAETFKKVDTLKNHHDWGPGSFVQGRAYRQHPESRRLQAMDLPSGALAWEGANPSGSIPGLRTLGPLLLTCGGDKQAFDRGTGQLRWETNQARYCGAVAQFEGFLAFYDAHGASGQPAVIMQDIQNGQVHQVLPVSGQVYGISYHQASGTLLAYSSAGVYAWRRSL